MDLQSIIYYKRFTLHSGNVFYKWIYLTFRECVLQMNLPYIRGMWFTNGFIYIRGMWLQTTYLHLDNVFTKRFTYIWGMCICNDLDKLF